MSLTEWAVTRVTLEDKKALKQLAVKMQVSFSELLRKVLRRAIKACGGDTV